MDIIESFSELKWEYFIAALAAILLLSFYKIWKSKTIVVTIEPKEEESVVDISSDRERKRR